MTATSRRFGIPLAILLGLAVVPIAVARMAPNRVDDCADPVLLMDVSRVSENTVVEREPRADRANKSVSGRIQPEHRRQAPLEFVMIRAYGLPRRFLHPSAPGQLEPDQHDVEWLEVDGELLPVHLVQQKVERGTSFAVYVFAYENRPVVGPFASRMASAASELIFGSRPISLIAVSGSTGRLYKRETERRAKEWIAAAWRHHRAACAG
ncbi:MAG: hypothetical protein O7A09_12665 [Proteobacteria bacterium]|nr:hypothetical protein [Pseudomonadota bacterium]MCZ6783604.1 hypothetical protein [Pseudomonadota bacterium]